MTSRARPRILLIDDDLAISRGLARALEREVDAVIAMSGADALEILRSDGPFDLVLSDVMMPGMTGGELFERVRAINPELVRHFVFLSGGMNELEDERIVATGARRLTKPVTVAAVRALLRLG